jgi:uncharacterized coiled-coil protein SlyX
MLYLLIALTSLFVINAAISGILYYKYKKQEKKTIEILNRCILLSQSLDCINKTCEKTVAHSNSSIGELSRRVTQCEITVSQTANAVKLLSSGIRPQQSYSGNY